MRKKIVREIIPKENLLGCESKEDLFNRLLDKSQFVFPEYKPLARQYISKHTANLVALGIYSKGKLVELNGNSNSRNVRLIKHLEKLAEKGLAVYAKRQYKGKFKFNIDKIKTDWLDIDHKKIKSEIQAEAIMRINTAIDGILAMTKDYNCCEIASQLEFLKASLEDLAENSSE